MCVFLLEAGPVPYWLLYLLPDLDLLPKARLLVERETKVAGPVGFLGGVFPEEGNCCS